MTDPRIQLALAAARSHHDAGRTDDAREAERRAERLQAQHARDRQRFAAKGYGEAVWLTLDVEVLE